MLSPDQIYSNIEEAFKLIRAAKESANKMAASNQGDTTQLAERLTNVESDLRGLADHAYDWKFSTDLQLPGM